MRMNRKQKWLFILILIILTFIYHNLILPKKEKEWAFYNKSDEDDETRKQTYDGSAIILLKSKYKERIKNELELIGISRKSIYPDMQNKSQYIREKYL